jgi:hypothetical protein
MGIIENAKEIANLVKKAGDIELYRKIVDLEGEVVELTHENRTLKEELRRRNEQQDITSRLQTRDNAYYLVDGEILDGPFCMRCWDVDRKLVRERHGATQGTHFCVECRNRRR